MMIRHALSALRSQYDLTSPVSGYISTIDTRGVGNVSVLLGAGRLTKESPIDHAAGILMRCSLGDKVEAGQVLARLFCSDESLILQAKEAFLGAVYIGTTPVKVPPLIHARVEASGSVLF